MKSRRHIVALLAAGALARPALAQAPVRLVFTAIPDQDETRLVERFRRVVVYLQEALGVPVHYAPVKSYAAAVSAFTNNQVQLAWFGGLTSSQARRATPGSEAIVQGAEDAAFFSYFIANTATGLTRSDGFPAGIAGRSFSFGGSPRQRQRRRGRAPPTDQEPLDALARQTEPAPFQRSRRRSSREGHRRGNGHGHRARPHRRHARVRGAGGDAPPEEARRLRQEARGRDPGPLRLHVRWRRVGPNQIPPANHS